MSASRWDSGACRSDCMTNENGSSCRNRNNFPFRPFGRCSGFEIGSTSCTRWLHPAGMLVHWTLAVGRLWEEEVFIHSRISKVSPSSRFFHWINLALFEGDFFFSPWTFSLGHLLLALHCRIPILAAGSCSPMSRHLAKEACTMSPTNCGASRLEIIDCDLQ